MNVRVFEESESDTEALADERDQLFESIEDLERERAAGDLSENDYQLLRDRYTARAAEVLRTLSKRTEDAPHETSSASASSDPWSTPPSKRRKKTYATVAVILFTAIGAAGAVLLSRGTSNRLPGQTATGSLSLSRQQQVQRTLTQAETVESQGNGVEALTLYRQVLQQDPNQMTALSESGWLEFEAGVEGKNSKLLADGQSEEEKAETLTPSAYAPHLYLGSMYLVEGDFGNSVAQYRLFIAANPPASVLKSAVPFIDRAFSADHLPPPTLPAGS